MAIEAPFSKFRKTNLKIYIVVCIGMALWCAYDGYFNQSWIDEHTDPAGKPEPYLVFNRTAPPFFVAAALLFAGCFFALRNRRIVAAEKELVISDKKKIPYDCIEKIDKTHFQSKGFFVVTYKDQTGREVNQKLSDRAYDNLSAVLDELVVKIS
ncbi:MAG: hypothetical protein ACYS4W_02565 [Planctomycetota bacterium]|jgi:hypothetical protein